MTASDLVLPAPFDTATLGAGIERGRRYVGLTLAEPGTLFRNRYARAHVDITEWELWRGEPLWVHADRWLAPRSLREPFTNKARNSLQDLLVRPIARYGFDRLWTRTHGANQYHNATDAQADADAALDEAAWWEDVAILRELHATGQLDFKPIDDTEGPVRRQLTARPGRYQGYDHTEALAEAHHDGQQIGWMTSNGALVPLSDDLLQRPSRPRTRRRR